ncbi:hypothetical protein [Moraxella lacunata]|uniref:hypothetical protein n=1 Tax=Moraxella lacunata TaxID=477 RepID=UPI003EE2BEFA
MAGVSSAVATSTAGSVGAGCVVGVAGVSAVVGAGGAVSVLSPPQAVNRATKLSGRIAFFMRVISFGLNEI